MKLSKAQQELLDAMQAGAVVHYMSGISSRFFRTDTMKNCRAPAEVLMRLGLVEKRREDWRGFTLQVKKEA